ncbi:hypothetical protein HPB49_013262 [Dermacentor silvarum]|uniref:Uncharacterized protein n=1 Tax=Dermacentor silvarum TaxID=543639 RepID=A0ACB8C3S5_DERSI|nr:hypothetical protein HPB49_013262 [Dermacentor silvarum]
MSVPGRERYESPQSVFGPLSIASPALQEPQGKAAVCSRGFLFGALAVFVLLLLVALVALSLDGGVQRVPGAEVLGCCYREAQAMRQRLNLSVNPCRNLYRHVCDSFTSDGEFPSFKIFQYHSQADFYSSPPHRAGQVIYTLFQSCLTATANAHKMGGSTVATIIDAVGAETALRARTEQGILAFLLRMTVKYDIWTHPTIAVYGRGGFPRFVRFYGMTRMHEFLAIVLRATGPLLQSVEAAEYALIRRDSIESINHILNINVTLEQIEAIQYDLNLNETVAHDISSSELLAELVPSLTIDDWKTVVENVSGGSLPPKLYHASLQALRKTFSVIMDRRRHPATLAFFIMNAAQNLLLELIMGRARRSTTGVFDFCHGVISYYPTVSIVAALKRMMKNGEHDAVFRRMFSEIIAAVSRKAAAVFPSADQRKLSAYLKPLKILLPSDIFPVHRPLPNFTSDYIRNRIIIFTSGWALTSYKPPPGISPTFTEAARLRKIIVDNNSVVIPIFAYSVLTFNNRTENLVAMSAVGVQLVDAIWSYVLKNPAWSEETKTIVSNFKACQKNLTSLVSDRYGLFEVTLTSIDTALDVARVPHWLDMFLADSLFRMSRCRLFVYLFVHHHYCPEAWAFKEKLAQEVQYIASVSEDFRLAFKCPLPKTQVPKCSFAKEK